MVFTEAERGSDGGLYNAEKRAALLLTNIVNLSIGVFGSLFCPLS